MAERAPVGSRRIRRPEVRRRWLLLWGFVVISGSFLASVALHSRDVTDPDDLFYDPRRPDVGGAMEAWEEAVLLVRTNETDRLVFDASGGDYEQLLRSTRSALDRLGVPSTETRSIAPERNAVLYLEHPLCLDNSQWDSLRTWVEMGGALVVSGPIAVRDGEGEWLHWDRMRSLLDIDRLEERRDARPSFITLAYHIPLVDGDLQGYRIALKQGSHILGIVDDEPLAYWSGFHREPIPERDRPLAAATARTLGAGRIVWLGFPLGWLHEDPENDRAASLWLRGLLNWCTGKRALASLELWPEEAEAAVLLTQDTEEDFGQARAFADLLDHHRLQGTFLCVSNEAEGHSGLISEIAVRHEIGSHSDDHLPIAGESHRNQKRRLEGSARSLEKMSGYRPRGFRPPEESYDRHTLMAMKETGYSYLLGDGSASWAAPRLLSVQTPGNESVGRLVQIPRLVRDDYNLLVSSKTSPDSVSFEFARDLEIVRSYRGVNLVSIHTHLLGRADMVQALGPFIESLREMPVWVATGSEVADWVSQRNDIRVHVESDQGQPDDGGTVVRVVNSGGESVSGLVLVICARYGQGPEAGPEPDGRPDRLGRVVCRLPRIAPGDEIVVVLAAADAA